MLSQLVANCGGAPKQTTADAGHFCILPSFCIYVSAWYIR